MLIVNFFLFTTIGKASFWDIVIKM